LSQAIERLQLPGTINRYQQKMRSFFESFAKKPRSDFNGRMTTTGFQQPFGGDGMAVTGWWEDF
jgi:hypothetical protein